MKETADKTLSKVRREIRESRKMLDTVNRLHAAEVSLTFALTALAVVACN